MRTWNAPERYDPDRGSMRSFLLAQVHGRAVDLLRAENARRAREQRDALRSPRVDDDLEREVLDLAEAEAVRHALATLSEGERAAIELAYFGGHDLQRGRGAARAARRHREEPDPFRPAAPARRAHRRGSAPMTTPSNPAELDALLGAYVLDALEADERAQVEQYLEQDDPRARAEVDELRETVAALAAAPGRRTTRRRSSGTASRPRSTNDDGERRARGAPGPQGVAAGRVDHLGRRRGGRGRASIVLAAAGRVAERRPRRRAPADGREHRRGVRPRHGDRRRPHTRRSPRTAGRRVSCCCPTAPATSSTTVCRRVDGATRRISCGRSPATGAEPTIVSAGCSDPIRRARQLQARRPGRRRSR